MCRMLAAYMGEGEEIKAAMVARIDEMEYLLKFCYKPS